MKSPTLFLLLLTLCLSCATHGAESNPAAKQPLPPIEQAGDGTVNLHARDATIHGKTVRYEPQPHKNTIGYWTKVEDWVSWDFKLQTPGTFTVELLQACGKGSGGSEYAVTIGDQTLKDKVRETSPTGAFTNFTPRVLGTVTLTKPGDYTLSVKPITKPGVAVMDLRLITLTPKKPE